MRQLITIISEPTETYRTLRRNPKLLLPSLLLMLGSLLSAWLLAPAYGNDLSRELVKLGETNGAVYQNPVFMLMYYVRALLYVPILTLIGGWYLQFVSKRIGAERNTRQMMVVSLYATMPIVLGDLLSGMMSRLSGSTSMAEATLNLGAFLSSNVGFGYAFAALIDPFVFLSLGLYLIGAKVMIEAAWYRLVLWIVPIWLLVKLVTAIWNGITSL